MPAFKPWGSVARPGRPGKLKAYPTRAEHARAHRLAAERARRNRRRVRKGLPVPGGFRTTGTITWNLTIDTSGLEAAFEGIGRSLRRFGESMSTVYAQLLEFHHPTLARLYGPPAEETTGPDTDPCSGSPSMAVVVLTQPVEVGPPDWDHPVKGAGRHPAERHDRGAPRRAVVGSGPASCAGRVHAAGGRALGARPGRDREPKHRTLLTYRRG
ncbi:hypothetical protein ACWEF6_02720 [Amycolatopsis sp. NPDC004772]